MNNQQRIKDFCSKLDKDARCGHHGNLLNGKPCPYCFPEFSTTKGQESEPSPVLLAPRTVLSEAQRVMIQSKVDEWSSSEATFRAVEECNELADALLKIRRNRISVDELKGEIADMRIVLEHLEYRFGNYQQQLNDKVKKCG